MAMNKYLLIITLNVNGLNAPIKRHRLAEWIRNHELIPFAMACMELESIMLSEISQAVRDKYHMITPLTRT